MAQLEELTKWCEQARKLLALLDNERDALLDNAPVVKKLLELMQKTPATYPGLSGWLQQFESYATAARDAREAVKRKTLKEAEGRKRVQQASQNLLRLRHELQLAIAAEDPLAAPEVRKQVLTAARHKPVYLDKRERIGDAIKELSALPGTAVQVSALQLLLDQASRLEPDYQAAYDKLEGLTANLRDGRAAAEHFANGLGDPTLKQRLAETQQLLDTYRSLRGMGDPELLGELTKRRADVLVVIDKAGPSGRALAIKTADQDLTTLKNDIQQEIEKTNRVKRELDEQARVITRRMEELKACAPKAVLLDWIKVVGAAENMASIQRYEDALQAYKDLKTGFTAVYETHANAAGRWNVVNEELEPLIEAVGPLLETSLRREHPELANVAGPLRSAVVTEIRANLIPAHHYVEALALESSRSIRENLRKIVGALRELEEGKTPVLDFGNKLTKQQVQLGLLEAEIFKAVDKLNEAITQLEEGGGDISEARQTVRDQEEAWRKEKESFYGSKSKTPLTDEERDKILEALDGKHAEIVLKLTDAAIAALETLRDPVQLKKSQDDKQNALALSTFRSKAAAATQGIEYIDGFGLAETHGWLTASPALASLRSQLQNLFDRASTGDCDEIGLQTLTELIAHKRQLVEAEMLKSRQAATESAKLVGNDLETLRKADKGDKARVAFHDKQASRLADLLAMVNSTVPAVSEEGTRLLALFKSEVDGFKTEAGKKTGGQNFAAVDLKLKALQADLEGKDFKTWLPTLQAPLENEFKQLLPTKLIGMSPQEALVLVAELQGRVTTALSQLADLKNAGNDLKTKLSDARKALELSSVKKGQPKVYADLKRRLDAAAEAPEHDVKLTVESVKAIHQLIDAAGTPANAQRMADKLERDAFQAERAKADYESALDVFEKNDLRRITTLKKDFASNSGNFNDALFDQVLSHRKDAEREAKANNYAAAREHLRLARATATALIAQPLKAEAASRQSLLNCMTNWRNAVRDHVIAVGKLSKLISDAIATDGSLGTDKAARATHALTPLQTLFNANLFDKAVLALTKDTQDPAELKARGPAKEQALAQLRNAERVLNENEVLSSLRGNPFGSFNTAALAAALRDMKGALLAS